MITSKGTSSGMSLVCTSSGLKDMKLHKYNKTVYHQDCRLYEDVLSNTPTFNFCNFILLLVILIKSHMKMNRIGMYE